MDANTILLNAIVKETAAKVFESLGEEAKREILTNAVERILKEIKIEWSIREILEKEAVKFAEEHIKTPEFQEKIKTKVIEAGEIVMNGLAKAVAGEMESTLKSKFRSWVAD